MTPAEKPSGPDSRITAATLERTELALSGSGTRASELSTNVSHVWTPCGSGFRRDPDRGRHIQLSDYIVTGSYSHGIAITEEAGPGVLINRCDIEDNGGDGVHNLSAHQLDATGVT